MLAEVLKTKTGVGCSAGEERILTSVKGTRLRDESQRGKSGETSV